MCNDFDEEGAEADETTGRNEEGEGMTGSGGNVEEVERTQHIDALAAIVKKMANTKARSSAKVLT